MKNRILVIAPAIMALAIGIYLLDHWRSGVEALGSLQLAALGFMFLLSAMSKYVATRVLIFPDTVNRGLGRIAHLAFFMLPILVALNINAGYPDSPAHVLETALLIAFFFAVLVSPYNTVMSGLMLALREDAP
ncbi:MAG: hypothetical protein GY717_16495 [Rhodobacteraceae bacterium]|nr:hypothetical protein [Paracoccaceae bacterium]